jgi:hypothetical protein
MVNPQPRSTGPTNLLFDEDLVLERQEEEEQLKRRTAQAKRRQIEAERRKSRLRKARIVSEVCLLLVALALGSLRYFAVYPFGMPSHKPTPNELERLTKQWVVFAVEGIENFKSKNGRLPIDLTEIGIGSANGTWTYQRMGVDRYIVGVASDKKSFSFDSNNDPNRFIAEARRH